MAKAINILVANKPVQGVEYNFIISIYKHISHSWRAFSFPVMPPIHVSERLYFQRDNQSEGNTQEWLWRAKRRDKRRMKLLAADRKHS